MYTQLKLLRELRALPASAAARLVGWKLAQHGRAIIERSGGSHRQARAVERWSRRWLAGPGSPGVAHWLARPEAGHFWFEPAEPAAWARATCTPEDLAVGRQAADGEFDLIGSGPVRLGTPPAWRRDLYSGRVWPLDHASTLRIAHGDGSDIRTVWELSRCYHFLPLARAWHTTGDAAYGHAFAAHVRSFSADNPIGYGPHWASPMDVAIRAANWCLAVPLFATAPLDGRFWADMLGALQGCGRFLERHFEWHPVYRGNHYVSNAVGLLYLGTLFRGTPSGNRWISLGSRILHEELDYQVHGDGASFEGSLAYHRLVTEFFACAGELLRRNVHGFDATAWDRRVRAMYAFVAAYLPESGLAPMIGDADDGRLHALSARTLREPRRHAESLPALHPLAPADGAHAFTAGGFAVLRDGADHAIVRCGPVGLRGAGSHDHNDQLGFELTVAGRRVVTDSGTWAYTRDLAARHRFRAVAAHGVIQLGEEEPNPIAPERPWRILADRTRSRILRCDDIGGELVFSGEHAGYAHRPSGARVRRSLSFERGERSWRVVDEVDGSGTEDVTWRLHLDGDATVPESSTSVGGTVRVLLHGSPAVRLDLAMPEGAVLSVDRSELSDAYGQHRERSVLVVRGRLGLPTRIACTITPA
jgi:hypothetical protein